MSERSEPVLMIVDGGLESLIAAMLLDRSGAVRAWYVGAGAEDSPLRRAAAELQADILGVDTIHNPRTPPETWGSLPGGFGESAMLLEAVAEALRTRCARVIWPRTTNGDLDSMTDASDRALLVARLGLIESTRTQSLDIRIDTPLLDLSQKQLADLAVDMDAPVWSVWWALPEAMDHPEAERARSRWLTLLRGAGGERLLNRPHTQPAAV